LAFGISVSAQGPNGSDDYYWNADGKKGSSLKTSLRNIISANYDQQTYKQVWDAYETTDIKPDGIHIYDIYSNITNFVFRTDKAGNYKKEGDVYNREHTFPKSWFGGKNAYPMYSDLFHVMPTDGYVNNMRGDLPYGETDANGEKDYKSANGYSKMGTCKIDGYTGKVFEPNDEYKGDLARNYFYMATRYENEITSWSSPVLTNSSYKPYVEWHMNMLMRWSREDPVSEKEIARNNAVHEIQNNRNPFIDYPGLEEYIWGSKVNVPFSYDNYEATNAIIQVEDTEGNAQDNAIYDLQGRRVQYPTRGIYIRNGKKIFIK
jgi:endonuclease I